MAAQTLPQVPAPNTQVRCGCCADVFMVRANDAGEYVGCCPTCGGLHVRMTTRDQVLPYVNLNRLVDGEAVQYFDVLWSGGRSHGWTGKEGVVQFG